ncbi:UDP-N-acetylmuramoyl-tripeptide--D-alanyl-D-alanine ligase [bacterium]|nr:UDP-N-acetylmuramoyl-tripeptide--D-alanyl-D-alanine ligase [bacterium]MBT5015548.1 UDP-N-acetylmuramoyl-tripeptide--D-alanyl-D-alanine ligase [bacterium]
MFFNKEFIEKALPKAQILFDFLPQDISFSIDSRSIFPSDIFIALSGKRVDGHDFVKEVLQKKNAGGVIMDRKKKDCLKGLTSDFLNKKLIILVDDVVESLLLLAGAWRAHWDIPVIGITGSLGKTVTREHIALLLKKKNISYISSAQNLNSLIGLPLSILKMRDHHEMAVFEMGINKRGEMERLADALMPTIGLVTSIGHSHLEGLGSLNDIAIEKRNVFKNFSEENIGIINGDQPHLAKVAYNHPVIKFGLKTTNQIQARKIQVNSDSITFILKIYQKKYPIKLSTNHEGSIMTALSVAALGSLLGIDHETIVDTIQTAVTVFGRYQHLTLKNNKGILINDCYNASPESTKMALLAFDKLETPHSKIAVLGDMLELGIDSAFWHRQLGRFLRKTPSIKRVILVGTHIKVAEATLPAGVEYDLVDTSKEALSLVKKYLKDASAIFVKGSNALKLSLVVDGLAVKQNTFSAAKKTNSIVASEISPLEKDIRVF